MSIQAYDADMVEAPGVETLASGALANLWAAFGRVWPLWSALTIVGAVAAAVADGSPQTGPSQLGAAAGASLAAGLITGVAVRILLGRGKAAWRPDGGLAAYAGIVAVLTWAGGMLAAVVQAQAQGATSEAAAGLAPFAALGVAGGMAVLWAALRLTPWPIGLLVGDPLMTAGRAWRLMRGVVLRYAMAGILLSAPVVILDVMVTLLTQSQGALVSHMATTPLSGLIALLAAAVAAEVYRSRIVVPAETPDAGSAQA